MKDFRNLEIWQDGRKLASLAYELTQSFPKEEQLGLVIDVRRAALAVPASIARGAALRELDYAKSLREALGWLHEFETLIAIAGDLGFANDLDTHDVEQLMEELDTRLSSLAQKIEADNTPAAPAREDRPRFDRPFRDRDDRPPFRRDDRGGDRGGDRDRDRDRDDRGPRGGGGGRPPFKRGGGFGGPKPRFDRPRRS